MNKINCTICGIKFSPLFNEDVFCSPCIQDHQIDESIEIFEEINHLVEVHGDIYSESSI